MYCVAFYVRFYLNSESFILEKIGLFGMTLFEYILGSFFFEKKIFLKLWIKYMKIKKELRFLLVLVYHIKSNRHRKVYSKKYIVII